MALTVADESAHSREGWDDARVETWTLTFGNAEECAGRIATTFLADQVRLSVVLLHPHYGPLIVRDAIPRRSDTLELRADGVWMNQWCETPFTHWTYGLEAFGVELEDARDTWHGERGHRIPIGLDLECEHHVAALDAGSGYVQPGHIDGEVLIGEDRMPVVTYGLRTHWWNASDDEQSLWWHNVEGDVFVQRTRAVHWRTANPDLLDVRTYESTVDTLGFPRRVDVSLGHDAQHFDVEPVDWAGEILSETPLRVLPHAALRVAGNDGAPGFGWQVGAVTEGAVS
ncbi:MAG: hypothetical protein ACOYN3_06410 [Acidimicrobiia bacterium]